MATRRFTIAMSALLLLLVSTACGGDDDGPSDGAAPRRGDIADAPAVVAALATHGVDCAMFEPDDPDDESFGPKAKSSGSCQLMDEDIQIQVYRDSELRGQADGMATSMGCSFAEAFGITDLWWVSDANWTVSGDTSVTARALHDALGGKLNHLEC